MDEKKILIVEDEPALASIVLQMLEVFGWTGIITSSAHEALQQLDAEEFRFILMDLSLPDKSGLQLYEDVIQKNPDYRGRVVFSSGYNVSGDLEDVIKRDNLQFLPKPYSINKFKEILEKW
ncbi:MAG: response regulator [Calditrichia bacterium]